MLRIRYWRLTIKDVLDSTYPQDKANHWDIKCMQGEYQHFGIFWFRYGTPVDKEPAHGISFYFNDVPQITIQNLIEFLQSKYGGTVLHRQSRVFLQVSSDFSETKTIAQIAKERRSIIKWTVKWRIEFQKAIGECREKSLFNLT